MDTPYGPAKLGSSRQVAIPKEVTDLLGVAPGERLYFLIDEDDPRWVRVVPAPRVLRWLAQGEDDG